MRIANHETHQAACDEIARLTHRDLHQHDLAPGEKARLSELIVATSEYEDDPGVYEAMFKRPRAD